MRLATDRPAQPAEPARTSVWRQFSTMARRQVRLLVADRGYLAFLVVLPFIVGLLPLTVTGHAGFGHPPSDGSAPFEPKHVIALISFAAILMGATLTVRDLVGERAIFRREQSAGLSASAYLLAKIAVFGAVAVIQSAILVLVVTAPGFGKPGPSSAAALGIPMLELFVGVAATCVVAAVLGLALSALARTNDQVIMLLAAALVTQLVFAGGFIPVTGRPAAGDHRVDHARTMGLCGHRVDGGSEQSRCRDRAGLALAAHGVDVVLRRHHVGGAGRTLRRCRAVEAAPQGGRIKAWYTDTT